jgi:transposase
MRPYSMDLRQRVAQAVDRQEGSLRRLARRFCVGLSFVSRLLRRRRQAGTLAPKPHGGGQRPALDEQALQRLRQLVQEQPDATLQELRDRLAVPCSIMAVWRALRTLKITRKKKSLHAQQRDTPEVQKKRERFQAELATLNPEQLVFVDETVANTAMTRLLGRAPCGQRVGGAVPGRWDTRTLISGVRLAGVVAPLAFPGATDTQAFQSSVEQGLAPPLRPGDVVIWDNLKPHKDKEAIQAVERAGARVLPAPPWSPDLLPVEKLWSKVKTFLRQAAARAREALIDAMGQALQSVCPQDILAWFRCCGLAQPVADQTRADTGERRDRLKHWDLCATHA